MATLLNTTINDTGFYKPSAGATGTRPASAQGLLRYNSTTGFHEHSTASTYVQGNKQLTDNDTYGSSSGNAALSGWDLKQKRPNAANGLYWIKNARMPNALQMWVDMSEDGGGYDFYLVTGGTSVDRVYVPTNNWGTASITGGGVHSGVALGLDFWYPRSKYNWRALDTYIRGNLGQNINTYTATVGPVFRNTNTSGGTAGGNYTGQIMRSTLYGSGAQDWQVPDGGRWWIRDNAFGEPNGDYPIYGFLQHYQNLPTGSAYDLRDIGFNDGGGAPSYPYTTGGSYVLSTNAKS
jgi:hypothetical protein